MRRRALLSSTTTLTATLTATSLGATALGGLAGCAALSSPEYEFQTERSSNLQDVPCPNYYDTKGTTCGAPPDGAPPVSLTLDDRTINRNETDGTVSAITATLENDLDQVVGIPVQALQRYADDEWQHVTGWSGNDMKQVSPGDTWQWSISARQHPTPNGVVPVVHDFDPGIWAYTVVVDLAPEDPHVENIECSAVFTVIESGD